MPLSSASRGGSAYRVATAGRSAKKAVSNTPTCGTFPPNAARAARSHRSAGGLCSGANAPSRSTSASVAASIDRVFVRVVPPCTMRWATAVGPASPCSLRNRDSVAVGSSSGRSCRLPPSRAGVGPPSSNASSRTDELPTLTVIRVFMVGWVKGVEGCRNRGRPTLVRAALPRDDQDPRTEAPGVVSGGQGGSTSRNAPVRSDRSATARHTQLSAAP